MLPWPSMSPDFNPIKNLWQQLKVKINSQARKSLQELIRVAVEEWSTIPHKTTSKTIRKGEKIVIQMKGHDIDY